ncbi:unnamed protein product [Nesidiocoris tenuis]|uniref:Menorin-like domain-containing protein n=1 Tax=Nesidiocoris tenuis TaxID=355587 RepID=A0A6H5GGV0_9HEMI|nr:unnamed protein product [Nesidiocoris tenuis]
MGGPGARDRQHVDPNLFLSTCSSKFPMATISVGWTTMFGTTDGKFVTISLQARVTDGGNSRPPAFSVRPSALLKPGLAGEAPSSAPSVGVSTGSAVAWWNGAPRDRSTTQY